MYTYEEIFNARNSQGITQLYIANLIGISVKYYDDYEKGIENINTNDVFTIYKRLGFNPHHFFPDKKKIVIPNILTVSLENCIASFKANNSSIMLSALSASLGNVIDYRNNQMYVGELNLQSLHSGLSVVHATMDSKVEEMINIAMNLILN